MFDAHVKQSVAMATTLSVGDIAIVHYNSSTDAFSFVFLRDVEAGTIVNFTDNGWLAAGGFRAGENTVTYTAPAAIAAGTIVTLSGLDSRRRRRPDHRLSGRSGDSDHSASRRFCGRQQHRRRRRDR